MKKDNVVFTPNCVSLGEVKRPNRPSPEQIKQGREVMTISAAAKRAKAEGYPASYTTLRNFVAAGFLPYIPVGRRIYINYNALLELYHNGITPEDSRHYMRVSRQYLQDCV